MDILVQDNKGNDMSEFLVTWPTDTVCLGVDQRGWVSEKIPMV